jgi:hypothetical protein
MGWSFIENTTRRDVIEMLIKDESNQVYRWKTLKHCSRGWRRGGPFYRLSPAATLR